MAIKWKKFLPTALAYLTVAAVFFAVIFFPERQSAAAESRIVTIWNVDTFEGGRGSRTSFLKTVARRAEKELDGVRFLVTSYTVEGAEAAFGAGSYPDLLSFGVGLSSFAERCLALPYSFAGGMLDGACRAVPWCKGGYFLFSLDGDFAAAGETAISVGGKNLPALSAGYASIAGTETDSQAAYTGFLSGKFRYLLGTQRDICRFASRNMQVASRPLPAYNDLFQYISVLSPRHREDCFTFLDILLGKETEKTLGSIGMFAVEEGSGERTVNVFSDGAALERLAALAGQGGDIKKLDKYLKTI